MGTLLKVPNSFPPSQCCFSYLVFTRMIHDLFVYNFIHQLESFDGFLLGDADVLLFERHWAETVVEEEETVLWLDPEERGDILVVGQSGTEADQSDVLLRGLNVADGSVIS